MTIALAGNPNSGKSTLFNVLTGSNQYVGNWPGVTVEKKEGTLKSDKSVRIADLPGIYSLSPYTLEEVISRNYLLQEKPDVIINILDASNLERNLFLTTQLLELAIPVVVALNMMDVVKKRGDVLDAAYLSQKIGCPVFEISALKNTGVDKLVEAAVAAGKNHDASSIHPPHVFTGVAEHALAHIEESLGDVIPENEKRFYAVKLFERDGKIKNLVSLDESVMQHIEEHIAEAEKEMDDDAESIITNERYVYIGDLIKGCYKKRAHVSDSVSDKIDRVVTNRILALPIFAAIMFVVYYISVTTVGTFVTDWTNDVLFGTWIVPGAAALLENIGCAAWLQGLIVDGIVSGVGAVLGFVPQLLVLFILLAVLEECGYMARIAFILDRIFRRFGLSGKSFIPMLIGTGCGVPGIMASRTIENEKDRRMTVITTTFMPCGAKLPIIALIAGALFGGAWWVAPSAYFAGIAAIIVSGIMLKKTKMFAGEPSPFVMELPAYHMPAPGAVFRSMWERGWSFIKKAGTIILASTVVIWFTSSFNWKMQMVDGYEGSILESIGSAISWIFLPLGFGNSKAAVATVLGLVAKENVVGTFGILYGFAEVAEDGMEFWANLQADYTPLSGYSMLLFNLLCAPCFAAIGAIKREMNNVKWTWFAVGYQCLFAYAVSLMVYQFGSLASGSGNIAGVLAALAVLAVMVWQLVKPDRAGRRQVSAA